MEQQAIPIALIADYALRGGATGITLLMAGLLLATRPLREVNVFGALFALGAGIYAMLSVEPLQGLLGPAYVPLKLLAMLSPAYFWLFIMALFDDEFAFRTWMAAPPVAIAALFLVCFPFPATEQASKLAHLAIVLALMVHILRMTRCNLRDDLVAARRQFTGIVVFLVPLVCLAIGVIEVYELFNLRGGFASPAIAAMLLCVSAAFAFGIAGIRKSLFPQPVASAPQPNGTNSAADRFDLARLEKLMNEGIYLNSGLTIGELANRMNMPEHRLRRLINKGLGYRNFAAFINDHRIEEARRRLSEPETAREQITSLAFDLGYSSLAPFNRAFRERIGMSPSQYREKALATS
ncbi:helix-turn-helix domain-containing protein [Oricola indica]|uniref:AraC family transcriptional regulator n=1 Tax=Oricola indica TaxID=2872591 RepID=UPI003CCB8212